MRKRVRRRFKLKTNEIGTIVRVGKKNSRVLMDGDLKFRLIPTKSFERIKDE